MDIGKKIKQLRKQTHMSLEELGKRAGLTRSFLSQVEMDKTSPSLSSLAKILAALNVRLGDFFQEVEERRGVVMQKADRCFYAEEGKARIASLATGFHQPKMEPFYVEFESGRQQDLVSAPAQIFMYVLSGAVLLKIGTDEYALARDDCAYFDASVPHSLQATGGRKAAVLFVTDKSIVKFH